MNRRTLLQGIALAAVLLPASRVNAQKSVPGQAGWTGWMNLRQSECMDRARRGMGSLAVPVWHVDSWYVHGYRDGLFVSVSCPADDGTANLVSSRATRILVGVGVVRQSGSEDTSELRDALAAYMRGGTPAGPLSGKWNGGDWGTIHLTVHTNSMTGTSSDTYSGQLGSIELHRSGDKWTGRWADSAIQRGGDLFEIEVSDDGKTIRGKWNVTSRGSRGGTGGGSFTWTWQADE